MVARGLVKDLGGALLREVRHSASSPWKPWASRLRLPSGEMIGRRHDPRRLHRLRDHRRASLVASGGRSQPFRSRTPAPSPTSGHGIAHLRRARWCRTALRLALARSRGWSPGRQRSYRHRRTARSRIRWRTEVARARATASRQSFCAMGPPSGRCAPRRWSSADLLADPVIRCVRAGLRIARASIVGDPDRLVPALHVRGRRREHGDAEAE